MRRWWALVTVGALASADLPAWAAAPPSLADARAAIDTSVRAFMQRENVPGLGLALVDRAQVLGIGTYGKADIETGAPVTPATLFGIGSITKSLTALALLEAADRGAFDPSAPIARYIPEFRPQSRWRPITGYDLLTHTSGLPDVTSFGRAQVALASGLATGFESGRHWWYSNLGYVALGTALERIEAQPWTTIAPERVFVPLAMTNSEPAYTQANRSRAATGYDYLFDDRPSPPGHPLARVGWIEADDPDGFVLSTSGDMANYARFLLGDGTFAGKQILSPAAFDRFTHAAVTAGEAGVPGLYTRYGFGLAEETLDGHRVIGHTGGTDQYTACLEADVDAGIAAVALTNHGAMGPRPCAVVEYALRALRAQSAGAPLPPPLAPDALDSVPLAFNYARILRARGGRTLTFADRGPALFLHGADGTDYRALPRGGDSFFVDAPGFELSTIDFGRDDTGRVVEAFYLDDWYRVENYHGPDGDLPAPSLRALAGHYRQYGTSNNARIFVRHGQLWLDGAGVMWPAPGGTYGVGERWSPERYRFDAFAGGKAQRLTVSGVPLVRTFTP